MARSCPQAGDILNEVNLPCKSENLDASDNHESEYQVNDMKAEHDPGTVANSTIGGPTHQTPQAAMEWLLAGEPGTSRCNHGAMSNTSPLNFSQDVYTKSRSFWLTRTPGPKNVHSSEPPEQFYYSEF